MDPLLAKAEPISDAGSASMVTYLSKGKKNPHQLCSSCERSEKNGKEIALETLRSMEEEEEVLQLLEQRFPCNPWQHSLFPRSPLRSTVEKISTLQPMKDPHQSRWTCLEQSWNPWRAHTGADSRQELWPEMRSPH